MKAGEWVAADVAMLALGASAAAGEGLVLDVKPMTASGVLRASGNARSAITSRLKRWLRLDKSD